MIKRVVQFHATNTRPSIRMQEITNLISCIPLISYKIKDGDLDTRYLPPRFSNHDYTSVRLVMRLLLDEPNELNDLDYFTRSSLEHFMGTVKHYKNDEDVRKLLENPILNNLAFQSDRDE